MRKYIYAFFLLILAVSVDAQTIDISGSILDSSDKSKLPYGNIVLKNDRDSSIAGVISNEKGEFFIKNIAYRKGMYLSTTYMGYHEKRISILPGNKSKINTGEIFLIQNATQLKGATIVGKINYIEQKFDRKVFNINEEKAAAARSILDLLRKLPGVVIDDNGNVRYKGTEASIFVDDQPLRFLYPKIEMIAVDKVDKIELIDAAMRSGGDGRGGIINIRFKAVNTDGISGLISANANTIDFTDLDKSKAFMNLNYKKKKITFYINSSIDKNLGNENNAIKNEITSFQIPTSQKSYAYSDFTRQTNYNYFGAIYMPSLNTKLYLSCGFFNLDYCSSSEDRFTEYKGVDQTIINNYNYNVSSNEDQIYKGITVSYWHKFDTIDSYVKMYAGFKLFNGTSDQNSMYKYNFLNSNYMDSLYKYSDRRKFFSKEIYYNFFFNHSISKNSRWNLSYNLSVELQDSTANEHSVSEKLILPLSQFENNSMLQQDLSWRIGTKINKWKLDVGFNLIDRFLWGNYTRYNLNNGDTLLPLKKNYFRILPSATLAFAINKAEEFKLSLSQTCSYPYFRQLSAYIDKNDLYSWRSGNPELKPVDFYSVYLGYSHNTEKWNATAECFFNYTKNEVANVSIPITSLLSFSKPENIAMQSNTGIDLSMWLMVNNKVNFSLSSSIFHSYYDTKSLATTAAFYNLPLKDLIKQQFGYNIKYNMEYKIKKFYTMFYLDYYSKELTFDGYDNAWINSSFNISRKFFDNKLRITLGVNNILADVVEHASFSDNFGVSSDTKTTGSAYKRLYSFSIQYNFRQGDRGTKDLRSGL